MPGNASYSSDFKRECAEGEYKMSNINNYKYEGKIKKEAFAKPLFDQCCCCAKKKKLIDSHMVPQFILKNLEKPCEYKTSFILEDGFLAEKNIGLKSAGIFKMLCADCDSGSFKGYENEEVLLTLDSIKRIQLVLDQIAVKNLYKKIYDFTYYSRFFSSIKKHACPVTLKKRNIDLDIQLFESMILACWQEMSRIYDMKHNNKIVYCGLLDYVVPVAAQGTFYYNYKKLKSIDVDKVTFLHMAVFPLSEKSRIILFTNDYNNYYCDWIDDFTKLRDRFKFCVNSKN